MKDYEVLYTEFDYRTNDTDEVRWLAVGVDGELVCEGCHDAGTLSCTVTTDPDDHVVQSFTDGLGRTLLSRTFDDDEPIDTYSVYDDYGGCGWVVTPRRQLPAQRFADSPRRRRFRRKVLLRLHLQRSRPHGRETNARTRGGVYALRRRRPSSSVAGRQSTREEAVDKLFVRCIGTGAGAEPRCRSGIDPHKVSGWRLDR